MSPDSSTIEIAAAQAVPDMVQISDYAEASEVLRSDAFIQGAYPLSRDLLMKGALTLLDGESHLRRRLILNPLFNNESVATYRDVHLLPVVNHCLAEVAAQPREPDGSIKIELVLLVQRCLYRVAAAIAGVDGLEDSRVVDRFIGQIRAITEGIVVEWTRDDQQVILKRGADAMSQFRDEFFAPSCARRQKILAEARANGLGDEQLSRDVLTTILAHREDSWQGDDELPVRETAIFVLAASQTTANALITFITYMEEWLKDHPEDRVLVQQDPNFLRRCAFEALRMTVASPARIRTATREVTLESGRQIEAGQSVALWFIPANQDPGHFGEDAKNFNPRREVRGAAPWGLAFGGGPHMCPGRPLVTGSRTLSGKTQVDGTMVSIARRFLDAGLELDSLERPTTDPSTHYPVYNQVPARFTKL